MKYFLVIFFGVLISCSDLNSRHDNDRADESINQLNDSLYVQLNIIEQDKLDSAIKLAFKGAEINFIPTKYKNWVIGNFTIKGVKHKVRVKYHGTSVKHYQNNKYSYSIQWEDSLGYHYYKLIKAEEAFPSIAAINKLALKNELISSFGKMKMGIINGENKGAYYLIEPIKPNIIETNFNHKKFVILSQISDWSRKERNGISASHWSENDLFTGHIENVENPLFPKALYQYKMLSDDIKKKNIVNIKAKIDIDYMAKYLAIALVFNDVHFLTGDNLKLLYDFNKKKFYPIFRIESEGIPFESNLDTNFAELNKFLFLSQGEYYSKAPFLQFFSLLITDTEFRSKRDEYLHHLLINKEDIFKEIEKVHQENSSVMNQIEEHKKHLHLNRRKRQKHIMQTAFSLINKYLNYAHIYCSYDVSKKLLNFNSDAFIPIDLHYGNKLLLGNFSGINFSEDLNIIQTSKQLQLDVNLFVPEKLTFINSITKDTIKQHVYVNFIDSK
jgi:hypothetical protein